MLWSRAALAAPVSAFFTPSHQRPLDGTPENVGICTCSDRGFMLGEAVKQKGEKYFSAAGHKNLKDQKDAAGQKR